MENCLDQKFFKLIDYINTSSKKELIQKLKNVLKEFKKSYINVYNQLIEYYKKYDFWGIIDEDNNNYENLKNRISVLKTHTKDFVWLYNNLDDYQSKYILCYILLNWLELNTNDINKVKSFFEQYFDLDLFPTNENDIFVDCGAYTGDTLLKYINVYGKKYKRYYAYEMNLSNVKELTKNVLSNNLTNIFIVPYGVGNENITLYKENNESTSKVVNEGSEEVKIVKLDDDLKCIPTFIKMDIEGYEEKALLGAKNIIKKYKPNLAIALYHGYDDLWKLPKLISKINSNYKFYLRHYGGNLVPTEFILYCK